MKTRSSLYAAAIIAALGITGGVTVGGCNSNQASSESAEAAVPTQQELQAQIEKIRNDPRMPEQAKQMAIGSIQAQMARGAQGAASASQNKPGGTVK